MKSEVRNASEIALKKLVDWYSLENKKPEPRWGELNSLLSGKDKLNLSVKKEENEEILRILWEITSLWYKYNPSSKPFDPSNSFGLNLIKTWQRFLKSTVEIRARGPGSTPELEMAAIVMSTKKIYGLEFYLPDSINIDVQKIKTENDGSFPEKYIADLEQIVKRRENKPSHQNSPASNNSLPKTDSAEMNGSGSSSASTVSPLPAPVTLDMKENNNQQVVEVKGLVSSDQKTTSSNQPHVISSNSHTAPQQLNLDTSSLSPINKTIPFPPPAIQDKKKAELIKKLEKYIKDLESRGNGWFVTEETKDVLKQKCKFLNCIKTKLLKEPISELGASIKALTGNSYVDKFCYRRSVSNDSRFSCRFFKPQTGTRKLINEVAAYTKTIENTP